MRRLDRWRQPSKEAMNSAIKDLFARVSNISLKISLGVIARAGGGCLRWGMRLWVPAAETMIDIKISAEPTMPRIP